MAVPSFPKPAVTADVVLVGVQDSQGRVLLIRRGKDPFAGRWALPGGFLDENEPPLSAARRELKEETGLSVKALEQFHTFGRPGRDPRGWTITVAHLALVDPATHVPEADDDATDSAWHPLHRLPRLAFDHREVIVTALKHLRRDMERTVVGGHLLPRPFTLKDLRTFYEALLNEPVKPQPLRRRLLALGLVQPAGLRGRQRLYRLKGQ